MAESQHWANNERITKNISEHNIMGTLMINETITFSG